MTAKTFWIILVIGGGLGFLLLVAGPLHIPVRWDEKEKAFIGVVGRGKP